MKIFKIIKKFTYIFLLFSISGCVSVPILPYGENIGEYGRVQISVMYIPNMNRFLIKRQDKHKNIIKLNNTYENKTTVVH
jgi:hypothetical protein